MNNKTILIVGGSGLVGSAAIRRFSSLLGWTVLSCSRKKPSIEVDFEHISIDLEDKDSISAVIPKLSAVTHILYAALFEMPELVAGWRSEQQIQTNLRMLENLFGLLLKHNMDLEQVILLQGGKAYGGHVGEANVPSKESSPRVEHANFYWLQEDYLRSLGSTRNWGLTIFRPQIIFGDALNAAMNLVPAIGVYAALLKEQGRPLDYPGGPPVVLEAVDADLLADAFAWAVTNTEAMDETFNLTNGDVFVWRNIWPVIAESLGMAIGEDHRCLFAETLPMRSNEWQAIVTKYDLVAPAMMAFVGQGFQYADALLGTDLAQNTTPKLLSTVKIRQAGFSQCMDTEEMFRKWFKLFQQRKLLPSI
jgi:nucleoside-diphosphate-sugar epimerase